MRSGARGKHTSRFLIEGGTAWLSAILIALGSFVVHGSLWSGLLYACAGALFATVVFAERKEIEADFIRGRTIWHAVFLAAFLAVVVLAVVFADRDVFFALFAIAMILVIGASFLPSRSDGRDAS